MSAFDQTLEALRLSRAFFWKHADRFQGDEWDHRLAPGTMTARETLRHLAVDDLAALQALETGTEPDYEGFAVEESDPAKLREMLLASHARLLEKIGSFRDQSEINVWGTNKPLYQGIAWFSSEDFYHAGQLAMIQLALHPDWPYYPDIYGE